MPGQIPLFIFHGLNPSYTKSPRAVAGSAFLRPGGEQAPHVRPLDVSGLVRNPQSNLPKTLIVFAAPSWIVGLFQLSGSLSS
jgi:hypothetical protein